MSKPTASPVNTDAPLTNFSHCHEGILRRLSALDELPALLAPAARARQVAEQSVEFFREAIFEHHLEEERELFPAVLASAQPGESVSAAARRIASHFDSVSVCFSKGLGAPVGSALCGSRELIARAHRIRKMAGGGMRQAGFLAAAASFALDHHVERLADDHALAQRLAAGLHGIDGLQVRSANTNIVFVDVEQGRGPALLAHLKERGVLATGLIGLRFVTHLDVDAAGIDRAIEAVRSFFAQAVPSAPAAALPGAAVY